MLDPINMTAYDKQDTRKDGSTIFLLKTRKNERRRVVRLPAVGTLKRYSKALEYEYRVKTATLGTLKRYSIISLTLYLEWYSAYSILYSGGPH
jgi:hypothetical protein